MVWTVSIIANCPASVLRSGLLARTESPVSPSVTNPYTPTFCNGFGVDSDNVACTVTHNPRIPRIAICPGIGLEGGHGRATYDNGDKAILTGPMAMAGEACRRRKEDGIATVAADVTSDVRKVLRSGSADEVAAELARRTLWGEEGFDDARGGTATKLCEPRMLARIRRRTTLLDFIILTALSLDYMTSDSSFRSDGSAIPTNGLLRSISHGRDTARFSRSFLPLGH